MTLDLETLEWCQRLVEDHGGRVHYRTDSRVMGALNQVATELHDEILRQRGRQRPGRAERQIDLEEAIAASNEAA